MYGIIYAMWDYARKNSQDAKAQHESLADDLDSAFGHDNWRMTRNMDERIEAGWQGYSFTYRDGDDDGDFLIIVRGNARLAIVMCDNEETNFHSIAAICMSARQAEHIAACNRAIYSEPEGADVYTVITMAMEAPLSRIEDARNIIDGEGERAQLILNTEILDEAEADIIRSEF